MTIIKVHVTEGKRIDTAPTTGATVSLLMDGEVLGTTTYLTSLTCTLEPGSQIRPLHSHRDSDEISYVVSGKGRFWIEGETCEIGPGDLILQPANSKHTVKNTGEVPLVLLCFHSSPNIRKKGRYIVYDNIEVNL